MHIIIVGCGKVGRTLAEQLQEEETDLTLIDMNADIINSLTEDIDAMGIVGNGASINTLMEAGVPTADILIAVTASDNFCTSTVFSSTKRNGMLYTVLSGFLLHSAKIPFWEPVSG